MAAASKIKLTSYQNMIAKLFAEPDSDVEFLFNENDKANTIRAHTKFLSAMSPVFESMFSGNWKETDAVKIEDVDFDDFDTFMQCLYGKEVETNKDNVEALLYLFKKYAIDDIPLSCSAFIIDQLTIENVFHYLNVAITYDLDTLHDSCAKIISENTGDALKLPEFLCCSQETLTAILKLGKVSCMEHVLFDSCMKWARQRCHEKELEENGENIRKELGNCFSLIRFKEIEKVSFAERCALYNDGLFSSKELCEFYINRGDPIADSRYQIRPQIDFSFSPIEERIKIGDSAECTIQFSTSKPLVFTQVSFSGILLQTTDEWIGRPWTLNLRVTKDGVTIYFFTRTYNNGFTFTSFIKTITKILINEGKYNLSIKLEAVKKSGCNFMRAYNIKRQIKDNVDLVIHENANGGKNQVNFISALHFEKFDESNLYLLDEKITDSK